MSDSSDKEAMRVEVTFHPEDNLVQFTVEGYVDMETLMRRANSAVEDPDFVKGMNSLWDITRAQGEHLYGKDFKQAGGVSRKDVDERGNARVAVLVADELSHGLVRIFNAMAGLEHLQYQIFEDEAEALAWLKET